MFFFGLDWFRPKAKKSKGTHALAVKTVFSVDLAVTIMTLRVAVSDYSDFGRRRDEQNHQNPGAPQIGELQTGIDLLRNHRFVVSVRLN